MEAPMIAALRLMWRLRGLLVIGFLIVLGHIWLNDAIRAYVAAIELESDSAIL